MKLKKIALLIFCGIFLLVVAACGQTQSQTQQPSGNEGSEDNGQTGSSETIRVGVVLPLTGALAFHGQQTKYGFDFALEEFKQANPDINIELVYEDAESVPQTGATQAQKLIDNGASAILGGYSSSISNSIAMVAEIERVPFVMDEGISDDVIAENYNYTYRVSPSASMAARQTLEYASMIADRFGFGKKVILLHEDSLFGSTMAKFIDEFVGDTDLELIDVIPYSSGTTDLTAEVGKVKAQNPDGLIVSGYYNDSVLLSRTIEQLDFNPKFILGNTSSAFSAERFISDVGSISEYYFDNNFRWNPNSESMKKLIEIVKNDGQFMSHEVYDGYIAAHVLFDAIKRAGSGDREAINQALKETNLQLDATPYSEPIRFEKGQNVSAKTVLTQIINGEVKIVDPEAYKEADMVKPQH